MRRTLPQVYRLELPENYKRFWDAFNVLDPFDLERRLPCYLNTHNGLLVLGVWPLGVIGAILFCSILWTALAPRLRRDARPFELKRAILRGVPPSLIVMFGVVPSISVQLFSSFNCIVYEDDALADAPTRSFMLDDPSISCDSDDYASDSNDDYELLRARAYFFIFVWPVGATAVSALLLYKVVRVTYIRKPIVRFRSFARSLLSYSIRTPDQHWQRARCPLPLALLPHMPYAVLPHFSLCLMTTRHVPP